MTMLIHHRTANQYGTVPNSNTVNDVSTMQRRDVSPEDTARLNAAKAMADQSRTEFERLCVTMAATYSVREVAKAADVASSTIQKWQAKYGA